MERERRRKDNPDVEGYVKRRSSFGSASVSQIMTGAYDKSDNIRELDAAEETMLNNEKIEEYK